MTDRSKIIDLAARREANSPHRAGEARCLNCKHEWAAVAPVGAVTLQCPKCETFQGLFKGVSCTEFKQWQCDCKEWTFFIDEHGPYCAHCGVRPTFP